MRGMKTAPPHLEIACQQVLLDDASVFSVQQALFPASVATGLSPEKLLERYLAYIRICTLSIIRPMVLQTGIEFRLFGTEWSLITFSPPVVEADAVTSHICGGLFVQSGRSESGEFSFRAEDVADGVRVTIQLSGYFPMLLGGSPVSGIRFWLYRLTQSAIHRLATVRFLALLHKELTGSPVAVRFVNISIYGGRPV